MLVERTFTLFERRISATGYVQLEEIESDMSLSQLRDTDAYVLLGGPGIGKTTTFKNETDIQDNSTYMTARNFRVESDLCGPEDVLYIDGLDEVRIGSQDERGALDSIRERLIQLKPRKFRLSCRELHWLGEIDHEHLERLVPNGKLTLVRLNPLSDADVIEIIQHTHPDVQFDQFINEVQQRGIEFLMRNPQTLDMLLKTWNNGALPQSRKGLFDAVVKILMREQNREHHLVSTAAYNDSQILDVAGQLCVVHLLTSTSGFALPGTLDDSNYLRPNLPDVDSRLIWHTLRTGLFKLETDGRAVPLHRSVAEYLAGRTLSNRMESSLSIQRLLSVMEVNTAGIFKNLHGLAGWLATLSDSARTRLIETEPIGLLIEADTSAFDQQELIRLFHGVVARTQQFPEYWDSIQSSQTIRKFANTDLDEFLATQLALEPVKGDLRQTRIYIALLIVELSTNAEIFAEALFKITRDHRFPIHLRSLALNIIVKRFRSNSPEAKHLGALLTDLFNDRVHHASYELSQQLVEALYPNRINDTQIWQYLCGRAQTSARARGFWTSTFAIHFGRSRGVRLFDGFFKSQHLPIEVEENSIEFRRIRYRVLTRILRETLLRHGSKLEVSQVLEWFEATAKTNVDGFKYDVAILHDDLKRWFEKNPEFHKKLIATQISRLARRTLDVNDPPTLDQRLDVLYDMPLLFADSPDYSQWYVDQALTTDELTTACLFLRIASLRLGPHLESMPDDQLESLRNPLQNRPDLLSTFSMYIEDRRRAHSAMSRRDAAPDNTERTQQWRKAIERNRASLNRLECPSNLLNELAKAYFGAFDDIEANDPHGRLLELLDGDKALVQLVLDNFIEAIKRQDRPSFDVVLELIKSNQAHLLSYPITAGLYEIAADLTNGEISLTEDQIRLALTIYLVVPHFPFDVEHSDSPPTWVTALIQRHPKLSARAITKVVSSAWQTKSRLCVDIGWLISNPAFGHIAHALCLSLIERFPIRATSDQARILTTLLNAAWNGDVRHLGDVVDKKLKRSSMLKACRVRWVVAGLFISHPEAHRIVMAEIQGNPRSVKELATAILEWAEDAANLYRYPIREHLVAADYQLLISSIAPHYDPIPYHGVHAINTRNETHALQVASLQSGLIPQLIDCLAKANNRSASELLQSLKHEEQLHNWLDQIDDAIDRQLFLKLQRSKLEISAKDVQDLLHNGPPVIPEDLLSIAIERITELSREIRDGNTSDWAQYWNGRNDTPKTENECRDAFLSDLRRELRRTSHGIAAEPEAEFGDDKRPDMVIRYDQFRIPVEVKTETSRDLWTAIDKQLKSKYMSDRSSFGLGIYLVFWFGRKNLRTPDTRKQLESPQELREHLEDSIKLGFRKRIRVCVIDVSEPKDG